MTPAEVVGLCLGLATLGGLFARYVALPYLKTHLVDPVLDRMDTMHARDNDLESANRIAAYMFEGHMTASAEDRGHLWDAVAELRKDTHRHDR